MSRADCGHEITELRWHDRAAKRIGRQCLECKNVVPSAQENGKRGLWVPEASVEDPSSLKDWDHGAPAPATPMREELVGLEPSGGRFIDTAAYSQHLLSPYWRALRAKVIKRAGGVCEGCLIEPAVEVHHRHYKHIYNEFAFDLVALCRACHEKAHHINTAKVRGVERATN